MAYTDPNTVQDPTSGERILSAWGDVVRDNQEDHEGRISANESTLGGLGTAALENVGAFDPAGAAAAAQANAQDYADSLHDDTGWILPELLTDVTASTFWGHLGYRRLEGVVWLTLALDIDNPAAQKDLFTLPAGFRPADSGSSHQYIIGGGTGGQQSSIRIRATDGIVRSHLSITSLVGTYSFPAA